MIPPSSPPPKKLNPLLLLLKTNELVENSKKHVRFLESLHALGVTLTKPSIQSLKRYQMWLSMLYHHHHYHEIQQQQQQQQEKEKEEEGEEKGNNTTTTTNEEEEEEDIIHDDDNNTTTKLNNVGIKKMIPPADIAWIWHCHRLAPMRYVEYLKKKEFLNFILDSDTDHDEETGAATTTTTKKKKNTRRPFVVILEADPPFEFQHPLHCQGHDNDVLKIDKDNTRKIWSEYYPNEKFDLCDIGKMDSSHQEQQQALLPLQSSLLSTAAHGQKTNENDDDHDDDDSLLLNSFFSSSSYWCGFDLIGSTERQAGFLWQVTQSNFTSDDFLYEGVERYYKFLCLKKKKKKNGNNNASNNNNNSHMLVPTYQIDSIWHTHILTNIQGYFSDCRNIMDGQILHHDDSLTDRTEGGSLDQAFQTTKVLWKDAYDGEEYYCPGGMYRGEPPEDYFVRSWPGKHRAIQASSIGIGPFQSMIHIQGATSTSPKKKKRKEEKKRSEKKKVNPPQWTSPDGTAPDGNPGFVKPNEKSTSRGVNANTFKEGYIFGRGPKGLGYYHHTTKESYVILHQRITVRAQALQQSIACDQCCGGQPTKSKADEYNRLMDTKEVVKARMQSVTPLGDLNIQEEIKAHMKTRGTYEAYYSDVGIWYYPQDFYVAGGGCGASGVTGGGCGGGNCGGGGCGGGGCGGGGCGGGGCGG